MPNRTSAFLPNFAAIRCHATTLIESGVIERIMKNDYPLDKVFVMLSDVPPEWESLWRDALGSDGHGFFERFCAFYIKQFHMPYVVTRMKAESKQHVATLLRYRNEVAQVSTKNQAYAYLMLLAGMNKETGRQWDAEGYNLKTVARNYFAGYKAEDILTAAKHDVDINLVVSMKP